MEGSYHQQSQDGQAPLGYPQNQYQEGKASAFNLLGMYEGDPYGDEVEEEDKNDGLNALVSLL